MKLFSAYRSSAGQELSHDERQRRDTNEKLSAELVKLTEAIRVLFANGQASVATEATQWVEQLAGILKDRGV